MSLKRQRRNVNEARHYETETDTEDIGFKNKTKAEDKATKRMEYAMIIIIEAFSGRNR